MYKVFYWKHNIVIQQMKGVNASFMFKSYLYLPCLEFGYLSLSRGEAL